MRMTFALPVLALGLAACATVSRPAADVGRGVYRAIGTEPFWDLTIGRDLVFTDRGNNVAVAEPIPPLRREAANERYLGRRLSVEIVHGRCSDGMSDRIYPDSVYVKVDGRAYRGCGADAAFFAKVGETRRDRPDQGESDLARMIVGRWVAASLDGRPAAPNERFALFVTPPIIRTQGLCNDLHGNYWLVDRRLKPNGMTWPRTERGCDPDRMTIEDRVIAVMWYTPVVSFPTPDRLRLTSARGMLEFDRAR